MSRRPNIFGTFIIALAVLWPCAVDSQDSLAMLEEQAVVNAVKAVAPSVVRIDTIGGLDIVNESAANLGPTTGVLISDDGYVLSSSFNFIQDPASIIVRFADGTKAPALIVARDQSRKLVLLKCDVEKTLKPIQLADAQSLRVGQTTIGVGRIYEQNSPNVSVGILSAKKRIWDRAVQTDAKISPANFGGPLIDLTGRVIGILVPMSPNNNDIQAGSEWYDSGIGFAVPLNDVFEKLDLLKNGDDLHSGLLGITFEGGNIYNDPAKIAVCADAGPAAKAGIKADDVIVQFNGQPIRRQSEFKHAIGRFYAGDSVELVVEREGTANSFSIELVESVPPYEKPSIGVLVEKTSGLDGLIIRYVIPHSPAADAGLQPGDRLTKVDSQELKNRDTLAQFLMRVSIGEEITVEAFQKSNGLLKSYSLRTVAASCDPIGPLKQATSATDIKTIDLIVPEFKNKCFAFVPDQPTRPPSVLVWIPEPGNTDKESFAKAWSDHCLKQNVALLIPQSNDETKWNPTEIEFITKSLNLLQNQLEIDPHRVAVGGPGSGGAMAALTCFSTRDKFSGLIVFDTRIPMRLPNVESAAINPLSIFIATSTRFEAQEDLDAMITRFREAKLPVYTQDAGPALVDVWIKTFLAWVDTLDRF